MVESKLNLTFYSGEDLYSDGDIEDVLLDMVSNNSSYEEILMNDDRWPVLYHLSSIRHNLLEWYDFKETDSILEIGSGCGAVTGVFCRKAGAITCIELSKRRSMINATRNSKYDNLEIMVGNFTDIKIKEKFDYVTLIGVLEYSPLYVGSEDSFRTMINKCKSYLKENGKLIIAIENKFGLKYWGGATEDHTGRGFDGINDYKGIDHVRTLSKPELEDLLRDCGLGRTEFYYPFPDYKLPTEIYSEYYLPSPGDIRFFDEGTVYDELIKDGQFEYFANSFLVFAGFGE